MIEEKSMQIVEKLIRNGWTGKSGLYVSVVPNKRSKDIIMAVADVLGTECDYDDLHCTVMYSKYDSPAEKSYPKTKTFRARMKDIQLYGKNEDSLVITLESADLQAEHERLKKLGAKHSWEFYSPHVTIQTGKPWDDYYLENVIDSINGRELVFNGYSWDDVVED